MNSAQGKYWQMLVLTIAGACLLSGCHHGSSKPAATAATAVLSLSVSVSGLKPALAWSCVNNGLPDGSF